MHNQWKSLRWKQEPVKDAVKIYQNYMGTVSTAKSAQRKAKKNTTANTAKDTISNSLKQQEENIVNTINSL